MSHGSDNAVCLGNRYTLLAKVGAGNEGEVWQARDHERGIDIAVKMLKVEPAHRRAARAALEREYAIASQFDHPFVLKVYAPQRDGETVFLPMEYAAGGDARSLRRRSYLEIVPVLLEVAEALMHVHARGYLHGDLKPGHVLFDAEGHVRLADFGLTSRALPPARAQGSARSQVTTSPQPLRRRPPAVADDIFSFGALACELLTGHPPRFVRRGPGPGTHRRAVFRIEPARPAPARLIALVGSLLAKQPRRRPQSMREVVKQLEAALDDTLAFDTRGTDDVGHGPSAQTSSTATTVADPSSGERRGEPEYSSEHPAASGGPLGAMPGPIRAVREEASSGLHAALDGDSESMHAQAPSGWARRAPPHASRGRWVLAVVVVAILSGITVSLLHPSPRVGRHLRTSLTRLRQSGPQEVFGEIMDRLSGLLGAVHPRAAPMGGRPAGRADVSGAPGNAERDAKVRDALQRFDARLRALAARGAIEWAGPAYLEVSRLGAEALGANEAGNPTLARRKLAHAQRALLAIERVAPRAIAARRRARTYDAMRRALLAGMTAEIRHDRPRATAEFRRVLRLDPGNAVALAGLRRTQRLHGAPEQRARALRHSLLDVSRRVPDAHVANDVAARAPFEARLDRQIRALTARPSELQSTTLRSEAKALLREEQATPAPSTALRRLAAKLAVLVAQYSRTVHVALLSDDRTRVQIARIGWLGRFWHRDIDLLPGEYTVIGTRAGYREVRRTVTVEPGASRQFVRVRCDARI